MIAAVINISALVLVLFSLIKDKEKSKQAVSYTHLTLPTIYSV